MRHASQALPAVTASHFHLRSLRIIGRLGDPKLRSGYFVMGGNPNEIEQELNPVKSILKKTTSEAICDL